MKDVLWSQVRGVCDVNRSGWARRPPPASPILASIELNELSEWPRSSYMHQHVCCPCWKGLYNGLIRLEETQRIEEFVQRLFQMPEKPSHTGRPCRVVRCSLLRLLRRHLVCSKQRDMFIHIPTVRRAHRSDPVFYKLSATATVTGRSRNSHAETRAPEVKYPKYSMVTVRLWCTVERNKLGTDPRLDGAKLTHAQDRAYSTVYQVNLKRKGGFAKRRNYAKKITWRR
ncbi:hypothetical protein BGY98DRAFT_673309 [Russula aff. rugulosa BPL654]|nr:hypothetical protein BGY98DRAFT_673309 [Russula aff. rugulosa BPL654]